jgi:uncharacterized protein YijF (DUF1287 family)
VIVVLRAAAAWASGPSARLPDRGIYPELDATLGRLSTDGPPQGDVAAGRPWLRIDAVHHVVTLYRGDEALRAYAVAVGRAAGGPLRALGLDEVSAAEIERLAGADPLERPGVPDRREDRDGDGIVDRLDILLGARKLLANRARYFERYVTLSYPGGDVPRTEGVCTDTVIRALRNAGIDLQKEVHEDLLRAPRAYPMVGRVDTSINHRRVKTLLPWFQRHFAAVPAGDRFLPGDVVFFDTLSGRLGPDHVGVVSDTLGPAGLPLVINNWAPGAFDSEMDLLPTVPVTHHFRVR